MPTDDSSLILHIDLTTGLVYEELRDRERLRVASAFEQQIWTEEGYGDLDEYAEQLAGARTITASANDTCVGIVRLFNGVVVAPPFLAEMPFYDDGERTAIARDCSSGEIEELGTIAVVKELRGQGVFENLARLGYRHATDRSVRAWGIIMEPERVQRMNDSFGFTFRQLGPEVDYQGGLCAAHLMELPEVRRHMAAVFPAVYDWFVSEPLNNG